MGDRPRPAGAPVARDSRAARRPGLRDRHGPRKIGHRARHQGPYDGTGVAGGGRGAVFGEVPLPVHISAVRKALGQDRAMLKTVSGRGYRLLGSWTPQHREATAAAVYSSLTRTSRAPPPNNFPPLITRLIARAAA